MDFGTLLQTAKQNENNKKEVRTYNTKFGPPKKQDKKDKLLSANIQKFLARRENEERKKQLEANKKKEDLLALRSKDKKATRRVNVMLKRTKSANQSVIDDAIDKDNTAVTLAGPAQPDEDDYGYVSQEASAFYAKMMEKYNKMPEEDKFPSAKKRASHNLSNTKDRVRAALEKEKLEAMMPHKRKRKHREDEEGHSDNEERGEKSETTVKVKPKNRAPPPMNFSELLRLASQKQHEPIVVEVKPKDEGPLFTKKQKLELEKEQQRRGDEKGKLTLEEINEIRKLPPSHLYKTKKRPEVSSRAEITSENDSDEGANRTPKVPDQKKVVPNRNCIPNRSVIEMRIPKVQASNTSKTNESPCMVKDVKQFSNRITNNQESLKVQQKPIADNRPKPDNKIVSKTMSVPNRPKTIDSLFRKKEHSPTASKLVTSKTQSPSTSSNKNGLNNRILDTNKRPLDTNKRPLDTNKRPLDTNKRPLDTNKRMLDTNKRPLDVNRNGIKGDFKPRPPPDVGSRKQFPTKNKRYVITDEDEEYDSEMDDFIDDGPQEKNDYSSYIREIFGYDKRRYGVIEDDVDNMESSFAQQMREDVRSAKIGLMEDLEDIKREKEEKRRKSLKNKSR